MQRSQMEVMARPQLSCVQPLTRPAVRRTRLQQVSGRAILQSSDVSSWQKTTARISSEWMWHFSYSLMPCRACMCPGSQVVCMPTPAIAGRAYHQGFTDSGATLPHRDRTEDRAFGLQADIDLSRPAFSQRPLSARAVLSGAYSSPLNNFPQCLWRKRQAETLQSAYPINSWACARLRQETNPAVCERWHSASQAGPKGHAVAKTWHSKCRCGEHGLGTTSQRRGLVHGQWENLVRATCILICLSLLTCLDSIRSFYDCRICRPSHGESHSPSLPHQAASALAVIP